MAHSISWHFQDFLAICHVDGGIGPSPKFLQNILQVQILGYLVFLDGTSHKVLGLEEVSVGDHLQFELVQILHELRRLSTFRKGRRHACAWLDVAHELAEGVQVHRVVAIVDMIHVPQR